MVYAPAIHFEQRFCDLALGDSHCPKHSTGPNVRLDSGCHLSIYKSLFIRGICRDEQAIHFIYPTRAHLS